MAIMVYYFCCYIPAQHLYCGQATCFRFWHYGTRNVIITTMSI